MVKKQALQLSFLSLSFAQELCAFRSRTGFRFASTFKRQNLVEKIVQQYSVGLGESKKISSGDYVTIRPAHCMTHDNSWPVALKFKGLGAKHLKDPDQIVLTLDHDVQNTSEKNLTKYKNIEEFAREQKAAFYPAGRGIGHQIMVEEGYAFPYTMVVASDSHSNTYGGLGCLGTPLVRTDAAAVWATGTTWWQIPPVARVELRGKLPLGVSGKDVIVALCGLFNHDEVLNHAVEFVGDGIAHLSIDERLTIANMTTEWGALAGVFPVDEVTLKWYEDRSKVLPQPHPRINADRIAKLKSTKLSADVDAVYAKDLVLDLATLSPCVAGPNSVKIVQPLSSLAPQKIKINKAYIVSCTNARQSDLAAAAKILRGRKIAPGVELYVAAASAPIQKSTEKNGDWQALLDAGAKPLPAGCGPCIGLGAGLLEPGEVGISATNRNFKGRMGSRDAKAYLASPAVVAASSALGYIGSPCELEGKEIPSAPAVVTEIHSDQHQSQENLAGVEVEILPNFPDHIEGELILCDADNVNTDAIYPGKYTYQDDVPREKMAEVCMENYDPDFGTKTHAGDILVSGFNFGTGSSREQAATCILARGIRLVIAGSFGNIFGRNAINNSLLTLEVPSLINLLRDREFGKQGLTVRTGLRARWNVRAATVHVFENNQEILKQRVGELGRSIQDIIASKGLEQWVKKQLGQ